YFGLISRSQRPHPKCWASRVGTPTPRGSVYPAVEPASNATLVLASVLASSSLRGLGGRGPGGRLVLRVLVAGVRLALFEELGEALLAGRFVEAAAELRHVEGEQRKLTSRVVGGELAVPVLERAVLEHGGARRQAD